uniref:Integrase zinc-binding domain-containing protein n=1 Tax=Nicotiana tabacum TaxID=4097 RepID=A0A1S4AZZ2_TOBAC|nr:PREDICTED: uncharacterized protein LOC107803020 [Nicotiana tabacum]
MHATICSETPGSARTVPGMVNYTHPEGRKHGSRYTSQSGIDHENEGNRLWDSRNEIIDYLKHGKILEDPKASRAFRTKPARYSFKGGQLYRRSFQGPLARCLGASEANYVMREVHKRICRNHSGANSLVLKLIRARYYWARMEQDAKAYVQKCDKCERHAPLVHQLAKLLHSVL